MSMLSSQIDHLCELADALDGRYGYQGYEIAMRDAADTIWQLRDDLQRANAAVQDAEHDESMAWDRIRKLEAENAQLRERVAELEELTDGKRYIPQEWYQLVTTENAKLRELIKDLYADMWASGEWLEPYQQRMRELGVEVSE